MRASDVNSNSCRSTKQAGREHFIPLRKADLVKLLASDADLSDEQHEKFAQLCRLLEATFHHEYHQRLEELKDVYAPFDPDADTQSPAPLSPAERNHRAAKLVEQFAALLQRANFRRLSRDDIERALDAVSDWGVHLDVDFEAFDILEVFARGDMLDRRIRRRWRNLFRPEEVEIPVYRRLVVVFRLRPGPKLHEYATGHTIHLKIFKNIPQMDLEMLLPGTRVKMTLWDQGRIWIPTLSGAAITVFKLIKGMFALAFAGVYGLLALLGLVGGTIGYGVKSFFGYLRAKDKYHLHLTRSLYYQNLDNNAGVLFRLLDEAEEQEFREAILAYFLLWQRADDNGWTERQLDSEAEAFLQQTTGTPVDFEVDDALEKLHRMRLIEKLPGEKLRAIAIEEALVRLDQAWDSFFPYSTNGLNRLSATDLMPISDLPKMCCQSPRLVS
jgi:hypothetical protein